VRLSKANIPTVKTHKGEFILDNFIGDICPWTATGYRILKRQSQVDPNVWISIAEVAATFQRALTRSDRNLPANFDDAVARKSEEVADVHRV
jgi:hypothetical protein